MQIRESWDDPNFKIICWMGPWSASGVVSNLHANGKD